MPEVLGNIGGLFKTAAPAIGGITAGAGLLGNIMNSITRGKEVSNLQSAEKKFADLTPEKLAGLVSRAEQPLDASLVQGINNQVQADMASRGLSEAPGIFAAGEAQALAPYKLQEQQNALQLIMKQMGLPIEYAQAILGAVGPNADVSRILALLMNQNNPGGGTPVDTGNIGALVKLIQSSQMPGQSPTASPLPAWDGGATTGDATIANAGGISA